MLNAATSRSHHPLGGNLACLSDSSGSVDSDSDDSSLKCGDAAGADPLRVAFEMIAGGSGVVEPGQLAELIHDHCPALKDSVGAIMREMDDDGSGAISFEEFARHYDLLWGDGRKDWHRSRRARYQLAACDQEEESWRLLLGGAVNFEAGLPRDEAVPPAPLGLFRRGAAATLLQASIRAFFARQKFGPELRERSAQWRMQRGRQRERAQKAAQLMIRGAHRAATKIQTQFRMSSARRLLDTLRRKAIQEKEYEISNNSVAQEMVDTQASICVQSFLRGASARRWFAAEVRKLRERHRKDEAAVQIQSHFRGFSGRVSYGVLVAVQAADTKRRRDGALMIQCALRGHLARQRAASARLKRQVGLDEDVEDAAVQIQSLFRGVCGRASYQELVAAQAAAREYQAIVVQCAIRRYLARRRMVSARSYALGRQDAAVTSISCIWRGTWARRKVASYRQEVLAATAMQAAFRGLVARRLAKRLLPYDWKCDYCAEVFVTFEEAVAHETAEHRDLVLTAKATAIQASVRCWQCRDVLTKRKDIEAEKKADDEDAHAAAVALQAAFRGLRGRRVAARMLPYTWNCDYCSKAFVTFEEAAYHENLVHRDLVEAAAATKVQATIRRYLCQNLLGEKKRHRACRIEQAIKIQCAVRCMIARKWARKAHVAHVKDRVRAVLRAATQIQRIARGTLARRRYALLAKAPSTADDARGCVGSDFLTPREGFIVTPREEGKEGGIGDGGGGGEPSFVCSHCNMSVAIGDLDTHSESCHSEWQHGGAQHKDKPVRMRVTSTIKQVLTPRERPEVAAVQIQRVIRGVLARRRCVVVQTPSVIGVQVKSKLDFLTPREGYITPREGKGGSISGLFVCSHCQQPVSIEDLDTHSEMCHSDWQHVDEGKTVRMRVTSTIKRVLTPSPPPTESDDEAAASGAPDKIAPADDEAAIRRKPTTRKKSPEAIWLSIQVEDATSIVARVRSWCRPVQDVVKRIMLQLTEAVRHQRSVFGVILRSPEEVFAAMDKAGTGTVDRSQLARLLKRLDVPVQPENMDSLWEALDVGGAGQINYREFLEVLAVCGCEHFSLTPGFCRVLAPSSGRDSGDRGAGKNEKGVDEAELSQPSPSRIPVLVKSSAAKEEKTAGQDAASTGAPSRIPVRAKGRGSNGGSRGQGGSSPSDSDSAPRAFPAQRKLIKQATTGMMDEDAVPSAPFPLRRACSAPAAVVWAGVQVEDAPAIQARIQTWSQPVRGVVKRIMLQLTEAVRYNRSVFGVRLDSPEQVFAAVDKDGSGTLDRSELARLLKRLDVHVQPKDMDGLWVAIDADGCGRVDYHEFISFLAVLGRQE